jgi:hypothetical protein
MFTMVFYSTIKNKIMAFSKKWIEMDYVRKSEADLQRQISCVFSDMQYLGFFKLFIHLFICPYIVWTISPRCHNPSVSLLTHLAYRQNLFFPLLQFC